MRIRAVIRALAAAGLATGLTLGSSSPSWAIAVDSGQGAELEPAYVTGAERKIARLLEGHQLDKALEEVQALLKASPNDPSILTLAGSVYFARGDHDAARKYYQ